MAKAEQQRILITQATTGMVLAQSVYTQNRVPLCGPGTGLNDELIHKLTMRGIKRVVVQGQPLPDRNQRPFEEQARECHDRFARMEHSQVMAAIRDCIIDQMARLP